MDVILKPHTQHKHLQTNNANYIEVILSIDVAAQGYKNDIILVNIWELEETLPWNRGVTSGGCSARHQLPFWLGRTSTQFLDTRPAPGHRHDEAR